MGDDLRAAAARVQRMKIAGTLRNARRSLLEMSRISDETLETLGDAIAAALGSPSPAPDASGPTNTQQETRMTTTEDYTTEYITSLHGNPLWEAIWSVIRGWDIQREFGAGYADASGDDCTRLFEAVLAVIPAYPAAASAGAPAGSGGVRSAEQAVLAAAEAWAKTSGPPQTPEENTLHRKVAALREARRPTEEGTANG